MFNEALGKLMRLWQARSPRERLLLAVGGGFLLFGLLYGLVYAPMVAARARLLERLPQLRAEHRLLAAQVGEVERLARQASPATAGGIDWVGRIESSAKANGLGGAILGIADAGSGRIRLKAGERKVEDWINWLAEVQRSGARIEEARVQLSQAGLATLEVTFVGGSP